MNVSIESASTNPLYCELCDFIQFSTYTEFQIHHLTHIRQPLVRLVKLNPSLCAKIQAKSYRVNTGVARTSHVFDHVPPLRLSIVKQQGSNQFSVKKECNSSRSNSPNLEENSDHDSVGGWEESKHKTLLQGLSDVEGKNLLERFGAKISISRKGKPPLLEDSGNGSQNGRKDSDPSSSIVDMKKENVLERLSGIGGISVSASKSKGSPNGNTETKLPSGISISSKQKPIDISQLKLLKDQEGESDKKLFDKNKILEKLSGSGLICIAPKAGVKTEEQSERKEEEQQEPVERLGVEGGGRSNKSEDSNDSSDSRNSGGERTFQVIASEMDNGKVANVENKVPKTYVRVKQSSFSKNSIRQGSQDDPLEEKTTGQDEERKETADIPEESGIDILERLTDNLNNSVGAEKSAEVTNREISSSERMEEPLIPGNAAFGGHHSQMNASQVDTVVTSSESQFQGSAKKNQEHEQEADGVSEENNENADENAGSFTSLSNEDQSQDQGEQQTAFWSDIRNASNNVDQPQEDPLLTPENPVSNGEGINFLQNFLTDHQSPPGNLPPENSEFMSLDRLGQTQHQQPPFMVNNSDPNSPMEQLSQQVQRMPNPTPQINVISQHHLQAPPPPPQLHTGVPLSPQHISPQQAGAYDTLGRMPPHMPPPLYPGYSMYNTNYPPQSQMPSPGMLSQRPIQPRPFQTMAAQRPRPRAMKRTAMRPPPPDLGAAKQRRVDPPLQVRPQVQNPTAKLPSGITVTPPKKTLEANKVANVLASRGITVTPTASRQTSRPQQKISNQGPSPVLNISSAVSITSSSQNRSNGGFAVPGPRRNTPIVNHHVERPERCTTVDLTQDEDMPHPPRRGQIGRYQCSQCSKIFASSQGLETHRASHRTITLPFKCDKCPAQYTSLANLHQHKITYHKKQSDLAIPIVDLNHPGAREQLLKCGVYNFIPLAQLQSNNNGYFGVPIIQLDTAKEKAVSNLSLLGAGNILVLGKMKALAPQPNH